MGGVAVSSGHARLACALWLICSPKYAFMSGKPTSFALVQTNNNNIIDSPGASTNNNNQQGNSYKPK